MRHLLAAFAHAAAAIAVASWCGVGLAQAPPQPAASAPYVDRVIEGLGDASDDDSGPVYNASGWPRHLRVESRISRERSSITAPYALGTFSALGSLETPNHGLWILDVDLNRDNASADASRLSATSGLGRAMSSRFSVRQRGFPAGNGVMIDNQIGTFGPPSASLAGLLSRVFVPTQRVLGASTQLSEEAARWRVHAAAGEPLQYDGLFATRVQRMPGRIFQVGAEFEGDPSPTPGLARQVVMPSWRASMQAVHGQGLAPFGLYGASWRGRVPPTVADRFDARSLWFGAGGDQQGIQWQVHALSSVLSMRNADAGSADQGGDASHAGWFDLSWRGAGMRHNLGGYVLGRGLNWGGQPMASDVSGAYYRGTWQTRQWLVDGGLDVLHSTAPGGIDGVYAVGSVRRRVDSSTQWGMSFAVREFNGRAYTLGGDVQWRHDHGSSDVRLDTSMEEQGNRVARLTLQHDWALSDGWTLTTSAGGGRRTSSGQTGTLWTAAASFDFPLTARASARGTVNFEEAAGQRRSGVNVAAVWPLPSGWAFEAGVNHDRGRVQVTRTLDPLAPPETVPQGALYSTTYYALLRYELRGGSASFPLGGRARDGGGSVEGLVYLDANRNGRLDAGERGASGVSVVLDGRYVVKTDAQGRFEFPWVAAGRRELTVLNESLPLPWSALDDGRTAIEIRLRDTTKVQIGVVQQ